MMALAAHLKPYLRMLNHAFPKGVRGNERAALLSLLFDQFSERNLRDLLAEFFDDERVLVLDEAIKAATDPGTDLATLVRVRSALSGQGWDFDDGDD